MEVLYDIENMLCRELEDVVHKGEMNVGDLDMIYKSVDIIKDVKTIEAMDQNYSYEYSGRPNYAYDGENERNYEGGSYGRGRNARRDARGRYSSFYGREYSRATEDDIKDMMEKSNDDREKEVLRRVLDKMKK